MLKIQTPYLSSIIIPNLIMNELKILTEYPDRAITILQKTIR